VISETPRFSSAEISEKLEKKVLAESLKEMVVRTETGVLPRSWKTEDRKGKFDC